MKSTYRARTVSRLFSDLFCDKVAASVGEHGNNALLHEDTIVVEASLHVVVVLDTFIWRGPIVHSN